jgi:hypothetical protein
LASRSLSFLPLLYLNVALPILACLALLFGYRVRRGRQRQPAAAPA